MTITANTYHSNEIQSQINAAKQQQNKAHQIAEYVRSFKEDDSHPAIQFAKEKWYEQQKIITSLQRQYKIAIEAEKQINYGVYIGRFRISHYCPCRVCNGGNTKTAAGTSLTPWHTIAVDQSVISLNSTVYIDGYGEFKAQDTGGAIQGNRIDVCVNNHAEAYRLGVIYKDVYIK